MSYGDWLLGPIPNPHQQYIYLKIFNNLINHVFLSLLYLKIIIKLYYNYKQIKVTHTFYLCHFIILLIF